MANLSNINNILRISSSGVGLNKDNIGPSELDIESAGADMIDMTRTGQKTYRLAISSTSDFSIFDVAANDDRLVINSAGNATFAGNISVNNKIELYSDGTLNWGSAHDFGRLTFDTGVAIVAGLSGKSLVLRSNGSGSSNTALTLDTSQNATFTGTVTTASRFNASTQALHFPNYTGTGWQIGADSTANGMYIYNENGTYALKLTNAGAATFAASVNVPSASIPTMSVDTNFVGSIYQASTLFKNNNYINIAGTKNVKKYLLSAYFINGDANQAVDIIFPNIALQGYLRITLSGTYSNQNVTGKLTKVIPFGWNPNGSIWGSGGNYTIEAAVGGIATAFTIGNIAWKSSTSKFIIPIYKLSAAGNSVKVIVEYFGDAGEQIDNLTLGGKYTISPPAPFNNRHYPSVERLQIGAGGYTGGVQYGIRLPQGNTDVSKIGWADNSGGERAAIICDSSTDSLHFYTGNSGTLTDRVRITAGGVLDVDGPGAKIKVDGANYVEMATFSAASNSTVGIVQNNQGYVTSFSTSGTHQNSNTALFVPVANGIRITKPGLLQVSVTQDFISTLSSGYCSVQIRKNGTVQFYSLRTNSNSQWDMLNSTGTMIVAANDEIGFYYNATDFTSMDTGSWSQYSFIWTSR